VDSLLGKLREEDKLITDADSPGLAGYVAVTVRCERHRASLLARQKHQLAVFFIKSSKLKLRGEKVVLEHAMKAQRGE
jgi:hypothetical protein